MSSLLIGLARVFFPHYINTDLKKVLFLYRNGSFIGRGARATVYKTRDVNFKQIAIKKFDNDEGHGRKSYNKELGILQKLKKVPEYKNYCVEFLGTRKPMSIVMECALYSLCELIDYKNYAYEDIAKQLIAAVNFIHLNGIVHLDIKPDNVLVFAHQKIKLADFGISMNVKSPDAIKKYNLTDEFTLVLNESVRIPIGTLKYEPIEILDHAMVMEEIATEDIKTTDQQYDLRFIDAWSTMCTLHELQVRLPLYELSERCKADNDRLVEVRKKLKETFDNQTPPSTDVLKCMKKCWMNPELRLDAMNSLV